MAPHNGILTPAQDLEARRARDLEAQAETFADMPPADSPVWNENRPAQAEAPRVYSARLGDALKALGASYNATQGHPDSDALKAALAACDALPRAGGLMVRPRPYLCRVCGFVETFSTNHTGPHYSACASCSWRGGRDDSGVWYSAQDKGRPHVYAGQNPRGLGEENPHARAQVKAEAEAQDLEARRARDLEALKAEAQDLEGKAAQALHNARVWARPGVPQETGDKAAQDAAQAEAEARDARTVANVLEALKAQAEAAPPRLALPSPYVLEAFARLDAETGLALVYLPQNVATPWASYRVTLATGVCVAGDYLAPYGNARALALRAFSERLGDALAPVNR